MDPTVGIEFFFFIDPEGDLYPMGPISPLLHAAKGPQLRQTLALAGTAVLNIRGMIRKEVPAG